MSLRINTNTSAFNAYRNLSVTSSLMNGSLEKLSSGYRINKAADDAAGLAISESLKAQINGLTVAVRNAQDGVSVVQTAEGALNETTAILQRMRDLAVEANNAGAQNDTSIGGLDTEFQQLASELDDIATGTQFNGVTLLDSSYSGTFQVGANNGDSLTIAVSTAMDSSLLGTSGAGTLDSTTAAGLIDSIDSAIETVSSTRATLGAYQNRLDHKINNLNVTVENLTALLIGINTPGVLSGAAPPTGDVIAVLYGAATTSDGGQTAGGTGIQASGAVQQLTGAIGVT